jgi:hypothetical protein
VSVSPECSLEVFKRKTRLLFNDEITTQTFRLYRFPNGFKSVDERVRIETEEDFRDCLQLFQFSDDFFPELFVWNFVDSSPTKLPNVMMEGEKTPTTVSRNSTQAKLCKIRDNYTCLCCKYVGTDGLALEAAHLYEIQGHKILKTASDKLNKLCSLSLLDINELRNLITMCAHCHSNFDAHKIGIHPVDLRWIIIDELRKGCLAPSSIEYSKLHGGEVNFSSAYLPPQPVLFERETHFLACNLKKRPPQWYCHFCELVFSGENGLEEKSMHTVICQLAVVVDNILFI